MVASLKVWHLLLIQNMEVNPKEKVFQTGTRITLSWAGLLALIVANEAAVDSTGHWWSVTDYYHSPKLQVIENSILMLIEHCKPAAVPTKTIKLRWNRTSCLSCQRKSGLTDSSRKVLLCILCSRWKKKEIGCMLTADATALGKITQ